MRTLLIRPLVAFWRIFCLTFSHFIHFRRTQFLMGTSPQSKDAQASPLPLMGSVTLRYPYETLPIPDHGRNQLHNAIEDCILCDKCARVCPVDCIEIESIRSPEVIGYTSNLMPKRLYAQKFDIDMAKCFFCGLCTTVCPTESLTMQPTYDYSTDKVQTHTLSFATLSEADISKHNEDWKAHESAKNTQL